VVPNNQVGVPAGEPMDELWKTRTEAMAKYFKGATDRPTVTEVAAYYRARNIGCVIFPVDSERASGEKRVSNEEVAELAAENSDVMIAFASIDPAKGRMGAREVRRLIRDFGVKGFKFHPSLQEFFPNDRSAYVLYEAIAESGLPAVVHPGQKGGAAAVVPHRPDGRGRRNARRRRRPSQILQPDVSGRCRRRFSRHADHPR